MTLGSLFDGSGTCPLAATMCGITPVWASEIEPYPIRVTTKNFPQMEHLGSVLDIHGANVKPVDIITFGSPCQDLSIAGKRAGIHDGQRSNLFFEAIRIIKEMREATHEQYPTFAVWENVPGAFSSNSGDDFLAVLRAFAGIWGDDVPEPTRAKGKIKWAHAGCIVGNGASLAWRVLDAQYWGVPQRRKRIYLVADFGGERAGEILFKREGLRWDFKACGATWERAAADAAGSVGRSCGVRCLNPWDYQSKRIYEPNGAFPTLPAMGDGGANNQAVLYALDSLSSNSMKSANPHSGFHAESIAKTLQAGGVDPTCNQGGNVIVEPIYTLQGNGIDRGQNGMCYDARGNGDGTYSPTLTGDHQNRVTDYTALRVHRQCKFGEYAPDDVTGTLMERDCKGPSDLVVEKQDRPPRKYIIRRLTPLECCRLQGFPDWWTDGVQGGDSAKYKMWGNGMALPCVVYVMQGIADAKRGDNHGKLPVHQR